MTQSDTANVLGVKVYAVSYTLAPDDCVLPVAGPYTAQEVADSGLAMGSQLLNSGQNDELG